MKIKNCIDMLVNNPPKKNALLFGKKFFPKYFKNQFDYLKTLPRFTEAEVEVLGGKLKIADAASFLPTFKEIFDREIYKFKTETKKPYIIDCGANIGLSVIYFKKLYPEAEIIGFEPDEKIFDLLKYNVKSFGYEKDIQLIQKALWNKESEEIFFSEGADAGRLTEDKEKKIIKVKTTSLRKYLDRPVDFLKIDIEGAETAVIKDCADLLSNVKNLFVEYHSFCDKEQELGIILNILKKSGFRYYIQNNGLSSLNPFCGKKTYINMDVQLNIYACRF